jgi:hypothetical protein
MMHAEVAALFAGVGVGILYATRRLSKLRLVSLGEVRLPFPSTSLRQMTDSADLYENRDFIALRARLQEKGYLFIRGVIPRENNLNARRRILRNFELRGDILDTQTFSTEDGVLQEQCGQKCLPFLEGKNGVTHSESMLGVLECPG